MKPQNQSASHICSITVACDLVLFLLLKSSNIFMEIKILPTTQTELQKRHMFLFFLLCLNWNYEEHTTEFLSGFVLSTSSTPSKSLQQFRNLLDKSLLSNEPFFRLTKVCYIVLLNTSTKTNFVLHNSYMIDFNSDHYQNYFGN